MKRPDAHREPVPRRATAAMLVLLFVLVLMALTAQGPGITWDEPIYLGFALRYVFWFSHLSPEAFGHGLLLGTWWDGQVHPPLGKLYIALAFTLFGGQANPMMAIRFGAGILFALLTALIFLQGARQRGKGVGLCGAAVFVLMPRIFAHGHFANLEMMTTLLWFATTIAFVRGISSRRWSVACGVLFGLALLTKINGVFLPVFLAPWGLLFHGKKAWRNLVCMALIGPPLFVLGWPPLWIDPIQRIGEYLEDKTTRANIAMFYLGRRYFETHAPWHYPFVLFLATTPLPVLIAGAAGAARAVKALREKWREHADEALLLWGFLFPVLLLAMPNVPKYDGMRLMMPAYPFLALIAAHGAALLWRRLLGPKRRKLARARAAAFAGAVWLLLPVIAFHPFHLCYYGELVGGPWGARKLGFETAYWCETFNDDALTFLNTRVPPGGAVALVAFSEFAWHYYRWTGKLRPDIRQGDFYDRDWDYLVVMPRQGWLNPPERDFIRENSPAWVKGLPPFGSPAVCLIYEARPHPQEKAGPTEAPSETP